MILIDWKRDYNCEFTCPKCEVGKLKLYSFKNSIINFKCSNCGQKTQQYCSLKHKQKYFFDENTNTIWFRSQKIEGFICPKCNGKDIIFYGFDRDKKCFKCLDCQKLTLDSLYISRSNTSKFGSKKSGIKAFVFSDDVWDLRSIYPNIDERDEKYIIPFDSIQLEWLKSLVKRYVQHLCKLSVSISTIYNRIVSLRFLSRYLVENQINNINQINRSLMLDFISRQHTDEILRNRLKAFKNFFDTGNAKGWFYIDQNIIRNSDYPKHKKVNPDPISDVVREQIENKLHILPEPIARMWIITFFTAMRPSELALLKKDCLQQEGANWKIVWDRKKGKDQHEVPLTRVIAKVIQEQQEYINNLWGDDWNYLFCHYQYVSATNPTQPNIKPVKKVIPTCRPPLQKCINCLINAEDIRDENGVIAKFTPNLVRHTRLTKLFEQGHDLNVVTAWAGHKQLVTTSLYYTQVSCNLIQQETGHIQKALFNADGKSLYYESMPKSFWENPRAHQLELTGDHINTPIYGYCGLALDQNCDKFRACYTCSCFAATLEKLPLYIKTRDELRVKESNAKASGYDVLVEQFGRQADQLDKIIVGLQGGNNE